MPIFRGQRNEVEVRVKVEFDDLVGNGRTKYERFVVRYRISPMTQFREQMKMLTDTEDPQPELERDVVMQHVVGWSELYEEDGTTPIEYSPEALEEALEIAPYSTAIFTGMVQAHYQRNRLAKKT